MIIIHWVQNSDYVLIPSIEISVSKYGEILMIIPISNLISSWNSSTNSNQHTQYKPDSDTTQIAIIPLSELGHKFTYDIPQSK
jgi:hypothetical protein